MPDRKMPGLPMALVLVLAAVPAVARAEGPVPGPTRPDAVRGELNEVKKSLATLERELDQLRQDTGNSFRAAQQSMDALKEQVMRLRKEVEDLRGRQPTVTRSARVAPPASGRIRLINSYFEPVEVVVNGTPYPLAPGEVRVLGDRVPGPFTYEVPGVQEAVERVLAANETFTIRIYPR